MNKHKFWLLHNVQSSDKNFIIVSIRSKNDLLRTYINQQTKHKRWSPDIVQSSDKNFIIISIERKSNLLRTHNQQTKYHCQLLGIVQTNLENSYT